MKKIAVITGFVIVAAIIIILVVANTVSLKNTYWSDKSSVLHFGETDFTWESSDAVKKGHYKVYKGKKAKAVINKYIENYNKDSDAPKAEKHGLKYDAENRAKEMSFKSFVLEEKVESLTANGESVDFADAIYIANKTGSHLTLVNVLNGESIHLDSCDKDTKPANVVNLPDEFKAVDGNLTSDKNIDITYAMPDGFKKVLSQENFVNYAHNNDYISISEMKKVPLYGIVDEYPVKEKVSSPEGYLITQASGGRVSFYFAFEKDGNTYFVNSNKKDLLQDFIKTIK